MRESSSCSVPLRDFALWRAAIAVVALAALAVLAMWTAAALQARPVAGAGLMPGAVIVLILAIATAVIALSLAGGVAPGVLSYREGHWAYAPARMDDLPRSGDLAVAIDLGPFMLLTLAGSRADGRPSRRWLPVQRRGLEREWHALRCAVYSPPLVVTAALAVDETSPE
jgi:hypothetical protein